MSAELDVPDSAYAAGEVAAVTYVAESDAIDVASDVINAAAPLIAAAELRRFANAWAEWLTKRSSELPQSSFLSHAHVIDRLRARADELEAS